MHATTRLLGGWRATFHTSVASEFCDEACDCHMPLFFISQSLHFIFEGDLKKFTQCLPVKVKFFETSLEEDSLVYNHLRKSVVINDIELQQLMKLNVLTS